MKALSSASVLVRTHAGHAAVLGEGGMPATPTRLLMRLNGYTPLGELIRDDEEADLLPTAHRLVDAGWAQFCKTEYTPEHSHWGDLLSSEAA